MTRRGGTRGKEQRAFSAVRVRDVAAPASSRAPLQARASVGARGGAGAPRPRLRCARSPRAHCVSSCAARRRHERRPARWRPALAAGRLFLEPGHAGAPPPRPVQRAFYRAARLRATRADRRRRARRPLRRAARRPRKMTRCAWRSPPFASKAARRQPPARLRVLRAADGPRNPRARSRIAARRCTPCAPTTSVPSAWGTPRAARHAAAKRIAAGVPRALPRTHARCRCRRRLCAAHLLADECLLAGGARGRFCQARMQLL